jgi:AP-3 complex subunit delta-1
MFEKSLQDMVKDLRVHAQNNLGLDKYISAELQKIKSELRKNDTTIKVNAVAKLTYLKMLGYDTSWAAFHIIEVMSAQRFKFKRVGYLAATQVFPQNKELVLLCTNLLKKDLHSKHPYAIGTAVNCVANIMDRDLARDLLDDLVSMMTSSKAYIRKKTVLVMFKVFEKYPQGLQLVFGNLKKKLLDDDVSVVSCTVNVVCELASMRPRNYVSLVPVFFTILQNAQNNWMLIKVVKLLTLLMPEEPRLAKKALPSFCNIIQTTPAKSLMYECINAVTYALAHVVNHDSINRESVLPIVKLCSEKLKLFLLDPDQNLKYLGLVGFSAMMRFSKDVVGQHRAVMLRCLQDPDMTIRLRALDLLCGMITQHNIVEVVQKLLKHAELFEDLYRDAVVDKILFICFDKKYQYISDFAWYVSILIGLIETNAISFGKRIGDQLIDICARVASVRTFAVVEAARVLCDERMVYNRLEFDSGIVAILMSLAFIVGEYADLIQHAEDSHATEISRLGGSKTVFRHILVNTLLSPHNHELPPVVQRCFMHAAMKLLVSVAIADDVEASYVESLIDLVMPLLVHITKSTHIELRERAIAVFYMLKLLKNPTKSYPRKDFLQGISLVYEEHLRVCKYQCTKFSAHS